MDIIIFSVIGISAVALLVYMTREERKFNDLKKHHTRKWNEDGIDWYEESGSIDPETFNRLKIKNKVAK